MKMVKAAVMVMTIRSEEERGENDGSDEQLLPAFQEFSRSLSAQVRYERMGFGSINTNLVYQAVDRSMQDLQQHDRILGASSVDLSLSVGSVLSAGFVTWVLRSGAIMSALMSTMPVWRGFDPLIILGSTAPMALAKHQGEGDEKEELSSAERVFDEASRDADETATEEKETEES